jgi:hypothetical protein
VLVQELRSDLLALIHAKGTHVGARAGAARERERRYAAEEPREERVRREANS